MISASIACCLGLNSTLAIHASAQSTSPRSGSDLKATTSGHGATPESPATPDAPRSGLLTSSGGFRDRLAARGITLHAALTTEILANVDGGFGTGATAPGLLDLALDFDLEELVGWQCGGLTISAFAAYGADGTTKFIGDANIVSNIFTETDFNVFNLFLTQSLADGKVFLKVGQIAVDDDFMGSENAGHFLNSAFGPTPTLALNTPAPIFPLAAPGATITIAPNEDFSLMAGIYAGDAGPVESGNTGFDWDFGGSAGYATFIEAAYSYGPGTLKLGGYFHSGEFEDFRDGTPVDGLGAVYGIIDHRLLQSSDQKAGLSVFARASIAPQEERVVAHQYYEAGLACDHIFHADDVLAFGVSHTIFGNDYVASESGVSSRETVLELTYRVSLTDSSILQPDLQYVIDPNFSRDNALVLGLRTELIF